ncbi:ThiF family adenylyltransferase [Arthrobacter sp. AQ5-06]|nr:ThiF family adenylyltransferase [Arthrobacter sp. AQ5-06]
MSLTDFSDFVAHSIQHFEEGLIRAGFTEGDKGWKGYVEHPTGPTLVAISLPAYFPFKPPQVVPVHRESVPWSWHRELNGALCLVAEDDHEDLWWREASVFLEHVRAWFESSDDGWRGDRPDLDLERYFHSSQDERLYLYGDLDEYRGAFVRFVQTPNNVMTLKSKGPRPAKAAKRDRFGFVADLGGIDVPPRNWDDLLARIDVALNLEKKIRAFSVEILVLTYKRGDHEGTIVVEVWPTTDGRIEVRRLRSGADTRIARSARSGPHSAELSTRSVAVVGLGALGSFLADMLVRAGVGKLTLIDDDVVMPGNLIRHLVGPKGVGQPKVDAVQSHIISKHRLAADQVDARRQNALASHVALDAIKDHDLVINATADFAVTALLHAAATALNRHVLSTALQNNGNTFRIDVLPPLVGGAPIPESATPENAQNSDYYDAGCGGPISPTTPHAVVETAAATVRHAVGLLLGEPVHLSGEVRHLTRRSGATE